MVCHHEFQENEVAYRCLEGFSDVERASIYRIIRRITANQNMLSDSQ